MSTGVSTTSTQPPQPVTWRHLITTGEASLIPIPPASQPLPESVRRAISTAYYAAFHALAGSNADVLIGAPHDQLANDAWTRVYRALNHNHAKTQLQNNQVNFSHDAKIFAGLFSDLQNERLNADYNPRATFTARSATTWLNNAEAAITGFLQANTTERAYIAVLTLIRAR